MSVLVDVRNAVAAVLNDPPVPWSQDFHADANFANILAPLEHAGIQVDVVPQNAPRVQLGDHGHIEYRVTIGIGIRYLTTPDEREQTDRGVKVAEEVVTALIDLQEEIVNLLTGKTLLDGDAQQVEGAIEAAFVGEDLRERWQYTGIISVTYDTQVVSLSVGGDL